MTFWVLLQIILVFFGGLCFIAALLLFLWLLLSDSISHKKTKKKGKKNGKN